MALGQVGGASPRDLYTTEWRFPLESLAVLPPVRWAIQQRTDLGASDESGGGSSLVNFGFGQWNRVATAPRLSVPLQPVRPQPIRIVHLFVCTSSRPLDCVFGQCAVGIVRRRRLLPSACCKIRTAGGKPVPSVGRSCVFGAQVPICYSQQPSDIWLAVFDEFHARNRVGSTAQCA